MRFDDTKITPDTACWWPFARRQLLRNSHEILEAENKNKKQISASPCLATKQRYNLTYIKKNHLFLCVALLSLKPPGQKQLHSPGCGRGKEEMNFPSPHKKLQQDDELLPMDDKMFP